MVINKKLLKPVNLLILISVVAVFSGLLFLIIKNLKQYKGPQQGELPLIEIKDKERILTLDRSGRVELRTPEGVFKQEWTNDKVNGLLQYLKEKYELSVSEIEEGFIVTFFLNGEWVTFTLSTDDELINVVFEEIQQEEYAAGEEPSGESIIDYFKRVSSPAPSPVGGSQEEETEEGEAMESGTQETEEEFFQEYGSQQGDTPQDSLAEIVCPFWRLSYCVYPAGYTPPPASIYWQGSTVVTVPDCELWEETVTDKTVISNTICVEEPESE